MLSELARSKKASPSMECPEPVGVSGPLDTLPNFRTAFPAQGSIEDTAPSSAPPEVRRHRFSIIEGPDKGRVFVPTGSRVLIGSHESADFVLRDRTVSRLHCEVVLGHPTMVRDLGSRNGTLVNQVRVAQAPLPLDAVLTVGDTTLRFELHDEAVRVALSSRDRFGDVVGSSPTMRAVFALCEDAAKSDSTVLIEGETGAGKEAIAEAIHRESSRREAPFLVVDCGAIPANLLETELFGHARGSFTGAVAARKGAFEAAAGGTILLDEIAELALDLQPKILRVIERREIKPVGQNSYLPVNVRVMAATHRRLAQEVTAHRFRADLYYRLAVLRIHTPPLRERKADLPALVEHLLTRLGVDPSDQAAFRTQAFQAELAAHEWPGNIRELRNYLERCLASTHRQAPVNELVAELEARGEAERGLPPVDISSPLKQGRDVWIAEFERRYLTELLKHHSDNVTAAARAAGIDRIFLYRLLWKYGLKTKDSRPKE